MQAFEGHLGGYFIAEFEVTELSQMPGSGR